MRGRRRRGVVMFWGERGETWEEGMERREKRKMNQKGVIVGWFFFCCYEFGRGGRGGVFWEGGGVEMSWWGMERSSQVSFSSSSFSSS